MGYYGADGDSLPFLDDDLRENPGVLRRHLHVGFIRLDLGERIVAWVVVRDGRVVDEAALIDHVARALTPHKRPRAILFVDSLPRNALGKVQKRELTVPPPR